MVLTINYPAGAVTDKDKYDYLYKLENILRLDHNKKGFQFNSGLIDETTYNTYLKTYFIPRSLFISDLIGYYRNKIKVSARNNALINASLNDLVDL